VPAFASRRRWLLLGAAGLLAVALALVVAVLQRPHPTAPVVTVVWAFEQPEGGAFLATPVVTAERVYAAAVRDSALAPSGVVYCLDRRRGTVCWTFDDDRAMLQTISAPCLAGGHLYIGEGMHGNDVCKLYCLEAASGRKRWQCVTEGHIESGPCVAGGAVFFGSGDDGIYCLDAAAGMRRWHITRDWHIDVGPAVADGRVYGGSGISQLHRRTDVFALDVADGRLLWQTPSALPVWGSPVVDGGQVFFGTGTGRLTQSAEPPEKPAGALLCLDAATGHECWSCPVADAVFGRAAVDGQRVYFGARDGFCHCLDRRDGRRLWQVDLGSPVVTRPALVEGRLYIVASGGRVACLDADSGAAHWTFDLAAHTRTKPQLLSSPVVRADHDDTGRHYLLYFGTELKSQARSAAVVYCLRD
jgi:outer membrane protein assembly factor BamB